MHIIVMAANTLTQAIHDRVPVILDKTDLGPWLNGTAGTDLLKPAPEDRRRTWPCRCVSTGLAPAMTIRRSSAGVPVTPDEQIRGTESTLESCPCAPGRCRCRGAVRWQNGTCSSVLLMCH